MANHSSSLEFPAWSEHAHHWQLDPSIAYLNHGSFGACPSVVLEAQSAFRAQLEAEPVRFFTREVQAMLDTSRESLADVLSADARDLVFVTNATTGVNSVLRSIKWNAGDELLLTDHAYNACGNVVDYLANRCGVVPVIVSLPFPVDAASAVTERIMSHVTNRTRLAMVDHVTSSTGLVLPIEVIVSQLAELGVDTLVDGAHAPGMVPLDLKDLNAAYYAGNCHKWLCAPKGAAFLHVRRDRRSDIAPAVISHGWNVPRPGRSRFHDLFDWQGTVDPTPWLCVAPSIQFMQSLLPGGLAAVMAHNRSLTLQGRSLLADTLGIRQPCPDEMIGSLASLPLPEDVNTSADDLDWTTVPTPSHPIHTALLKTYKIEVPVFFWPQMPQRLVRISMQLYNTLDQVKFLANALAALLAQERSQ